MKYFGINLLIAVVWLLLNQDPSVAVFIIGFLIGFALLGIFAGVLDSGDYVRRAFGAARFLLVFLREFVLSNISVLRAALFRSRESLHPNFLTYDVEGLTPFEILLLSYCITLTPGTTTVKVSDDFKTLVLHSIDSDDAQSVRDYLDRVMRPGILRFTR